MTAQFIFTDNPAFAYGPLPSGLQIGNAPYSDANFKSFTLDIANTSAFKSTSGTSYKKRLLDGSGWELPVLTYRTQKIETLPNLTLAGIQFTGSAQFYTYRDLLLSWQYAAARWIVTDDFSVPTKVLRASEDLEMEQLGGISWAARATFEVETAQAYSTPTSDATAITYIDPFVADTTLTERSIQPWSSIVGVFNTPEAVRTAELIYDIVFTRYERGVELFSFSLGIIPKVLSPLFEELTVATALGNAGTGIWKVSGDLPIYDNARWTINQLKHLLGLPLHMQVIYKSGKAVGTATLNNGGGLDPTQDSENNGYALSRFNNLPAYLPQMGVVIQLKEESAGYRRAHLAIQGATATKFDYQMDSPASFYALFSKLNQFG